MKNIFIHLTVFSLGLSILSCDSPVSIKENEENKEKEKEVTVVKKLNPDSVYSMNEPSIPMEELKMKVRRGDTLAYNELHTANLQHREDQVFWALYMAHRYDYGLAYYDVFASLKSGYFCQGFSLDRMDEKSKKMALNYLKISADKGYAPAKEVIKDYFPQLLDEKKKVNEH